MSEEKPNRVKLGTLLGAVALAAALPFACDDRPKEPAPTSPSPASAQAGELAWTKPAAWKEGKSASAMRKATYVVPKAEGDAEDAELSVIVAGGSAQANVERWEGQFGGAKAKTSQKNPNGVAVTLVEIEGEFAGGGPMMGGGSEKKPNWMLLGAIVETGGGQSYFFKLTGPKKTLEAARKDFDALVESLKKG